MIVRRPDALDPFLERLALDVLEHDERNAVVLAGVEHADDVRMLELRDRAGLAAEALDLLALAAVDASSILIATRRSSTVSNASQTRAVAPGADLALER